MDRIQLLPNIVSGENFNTRDFRADNIEDDHPLIGGQRQIPVPATVSTSGLGSRVKRGAEVVTATATVENHQSRPLCSQFGIALLGQELPKLGCERREHISEEQSLFSL